MSDERQWDPENITDEDEIIGEKLAEVVWMLSSIFGMEPEELWMTSFDGKSVTIIEYDGGTDVLFAPADENGDVHITYKYDPDYVPEGDDE